MPLAHDLTDVRYGRLVARHEVARTKQGVIWQCTCDCGNAVDVAAGRLRSGWTQSCGCLKRDRTVEFNRARRLPDQIAALRELFQRRKQGAATRRLVWTLTREEFISLVTSNCKYCGIKPQQIVRGQYGAVARYNGLDRVNNDRGYTRKNVVPCCKTCNVAKNNLTLSQWKAWVRRLTQCFGQTLKR